MLYPMSKLFWSKCTCPFCVCNPNNPVWMARSRKQPYLYVASIRQPSLPPSPHPPTQ